METLPRDILEEIALRLDPKSIIQYALVCRKHAEILLLDSFWRHYCSENHLLPEKGTKAHTSLERALSFKSWLVQKSRQKLPLMDYFGPWMNPTLEYLCPVSKPEKQNPKTGVYWIEIFSILPRGQWALLLRHHILGALRFKIHVQIQNSSPTTHLYCHPARADWDQWEETRLCSLTIPYELAKVTIAIEESQDLAWKVWGIDYLEFREIQTLYTD